MLSPQDISENIYNEPVRYHDLYWREIPGLDGHSCCHIMELRMHLGWAADFMKITAQMNT